MVFKKKKPRRKWKKKKDKYFPKHVEIETQNTAKMAGTYSLSTPALKNPKCLENAKNGYVVCTDCARFVNNTNGSVKQHKMERNAEWLWQPHNALYASNVSHYCTRLRLEDCGDLMNEDHFLNYINMALKAPNTAFSLRTNRPDIVEKVLQDHEKPDNLVVILSSIELDHPVIEKRYNGIDKYLFKLTGSYMKEHNIESSCQPALCSKCMKCFTKEGSEIIYEPMKQKRNRLTGDEQRIKAALLDVLRAELSTRSIKPSRTNIKLLEEENVEIRGDFVYRNGQRIWQIVHHYSKTGAETLPTLKKAKEGVFYEENQDFIRNGR